MPSIEVVLAIAAGFVGVLTLFVLFSTGSVLAVLVLWISIAMISLVLWYYEFIDLSNYSSVMMPKKEEPAAAAPDPADATTGTGPMVGSEVFHVSDSQFTYADAPAVCAAYGAELATLEQIIDTYNNGGEWCGYGWSQGGFALYPTQKATWNALQAEPDTAKRTGCGRPGVNGGYFDPNTKFGVNCFGFKPAGTARLPAPLPGTDPTAFNAAVAKFRRMLSTLTLNPYSRNVWSGYDSNYGSQFRQSNVENFTEYAGDPTFTEAPTGSQATNSAPYGLVGAVGPPGPPGPVGAASTVPGPPGPAGPAGPLGPPGSPGPAGTIGGVGPPGQQGAQGIKGDKGDKGDTGAQGPPGTAGSAVGVIGPKGNKGEPGEKGDQGIQGVPGVAGPRGFDGPAGPGGLPGPPGPKGDVGPAGDPAQIPRNLTLDSLKIGTWNIRDTPGGSIKFQKDGTNNPVSFTPSGRTQAAWHVDYNEGNVNDRDFQTARGEQEETWRSGW